MKIYSCKPDCSLYINFLKYGFIAFVFFVLIVSTYLGIWDYSTAIFGILGAAFVLSVVLGTYFYITFRAVTYEATDEELVKSHGILSKHTITVPYNKVSNLVTRRSISERIFGMGTIYVDATGAGHGYEITMKHLRLADMNRMMTVIRDMLARLEPTGAMPAKYVQPGGAQPTGGSSQQSTHAPLAPSNTEARERSPFAPQSEQRPPTASTHPSSAPPSSTQSDSPSFREFEHSKRRLEELEYQAYTRHEAQQEQKEQDEAGESRNEQKDAREADETEHAAYGTREDEGQKPPRKPSGHRGSRDQK